MAGQTSTVINARVHPEHAEQLRQIAQRNASTISRTVARIIAEKLALLQILSQPNDHDVEPQPNQGTTATRW